MDSSDILNIDPSSLDPPPAPEFYKIWSDGDISIVLGHFCFQIPFLLVISFLFQTFGNSDLVMLFGACL